MELTVYQISGKTTGRKVTLDDAIYGVEPNDHAIYLAVKQYMAGQRQGTHDTLEKGIVSGSTRKIKRQKGTGTARSGSMKSPLFRGGGRIFGPHPRDYSFKLNKKVKRLARVSALSYKAKDNSIVVLEEFHFDSPKTRNFVEILDNFEVRQQKSLFVFSTIDTNTVLASRNLPRVTITSAANLNIYDILNHNRIFIEEGSLKDIESALAPEITNAQTTTSK
jgi:large subunit ribosomal protein L4